MRIADMGLSHIRSGNSNIYLWKKQSKKYGKYNNSYHFPPVERWNSPSRLWGWGR
jgi:hypothetical protein